MRSRWIRILIAGVGVLLWGLGLWLSVAQRNDVVGANIGASIIAMGGFTLGVLTWIWTLILAIQRRISKLEAVITLTAVLVAAIGLWVPAVVALGGFQNWW